MQVEKNLIFFFSFLQTVAFVRSDKPKLFRGLQIKVSSSLTFLFAMLRRTKFGGDSPPVDCSLFVDQVIL